MDNVKEIHVRAANFTAAESQHLCDVLENYKHIIENKNTDEASLQDKQKAWLKVVEKYNSTTQSYCRTLESLQQNYKNMNKVEKQHPSAKMSISVDREILNESIEQDGFDDWLVLEQLVHSRMLRSAEEEEAKREDRIY